MRAVYLKGDPKLVFNDIAEDADRNGQRALELYAGRVITLEEARQTIGLDTPQKIKEELQTPPPTEGGIDPDKEEKKKDPVVSPDETLTDPNGTFWDKKKFNITTQWDPTGHLLFHIDGYPKKQL